MFCGIFYLNLPQNLRYYFLNTQTMYIHEHTNWTNFRWDDKQVTLLLEEAVRLQGKLYGRLSDLGFENQILATAENLISDVVYSSEIEGVKLNVEEVRSSIARKLGMRYESKKTPSHYVDAIVTVMLDAMEHYDMPLTKEKLCSWQSAFFSNGFSEGREMEVGQYRTHEEYIVSGYFGRERIHYIAPAPERVESEMDLFIEWFNSEKIVPSVIRSAIAHFWFVSIHPFEDGNGRLARILGDICLARGDKSKFRFYNMSSEINKDKNHYYDVLERTQHGDGDITEWLVWYIKTLINAVNESNALISNVLRKSLFWLRVSGISMTPRQINTLNIFLDGYEAKITSKKWADINKCSTDTALRDIQDLVRKGILTVDIPDAKRPSFSICYGDDSSGIIADFSDISIEKEGKSYFLTATYKNQPVRERILALDAERYEKGDLPLSNLLDKYFAYINEVKLV